MPNVLGIPSISILSRDPSLFRKPPETQGKRIRLSKKNDDLKEWGTIQHPVMYLQTCWVKTAIVANEILFIGDQRKHWGSGIVRPGTGAPVPTGATPAER